MSTIKKITEVSNYLPGKKTNKDLVKRKMLRYLYFKGQQSIPELSRYIKRTVPNTTVLLNELKAIGMVEESGMGGSRGGRKPNLYILGTGKWLILVLNIKKNGCDAALFDLKNNNVSGYIDFPFVLPTTTEALQQLCFNVLKSLKGLAIPIDKVLATGVCFPGLVNSAEGYNYMYFEKPDFPVRDFMEAQLGTPVFIENDTRVITLGEYRFGNAKGKKDTLTINYDNGIGLGMVLNGSVYYGKSGFSGEFGHIQVDPHGELCYCGKQGCLETVASGNAMIRQAKLKLNEGTVSSLNLFKNLEDLSLDNLIDAALAGDTFAIDIIVAGSLELGRGLAILVHLLNPEIIIINGRLARANKFILRSLKQSLDKYTLSRISDDVQVKISDMGERAIFLGVVSRVIEKVFD
jgi:predicted NBD/HSP70 family sugar kinase